MDIGIDADSTLFDLMGPWLALFNERVGRAHQVEEVVNYHPYLCLGPGGGELPPHEKDLFYSLLHTRGLYENLPPLAGAVQAMEELRQDGHHITIITSPAGGHLSVSEKYTSFARHFPWLSIKRIMPVHEKWRVRFDVFIDDSTRQVESYRQHQPHAHVLGIEFPWNARDAHHWHLLAPSHRDPAAAWAAIVSYIRGLR